MRGKFVSRAFFAPRCGKVPASVRYIGTNQIVPAIVAHGKLAMLMPMVSEGCLTGFETIDGKGKKVRPRDTLAYSHCAIPYSEQRTGFCTCSNVRLIPSTN